MASISADDANKHLGFLATFAQLDNPTSSTRTRELLRWQPTHPGLLADLAERHYFSRCGGSEGLGPFSSGAMRPADRWGPSGGSP